MTYSLIYSIMEYRRIIGASEAHREDKSIVVYGSPNCKLESILTIFNRYAKRNLGDKAEIFHYMKAEVSWRLIRRCIETIENLEKFLSYTIFFLVSMQRLSSLYATSAFMECNISSLSSEFFSV